VASEQGSVTKPQSGHSYGGNRWARPIIWHIMQCYAHYGLTDFIVLGGYRVGFIRQFFLNYRMYFSDFTIAMSNGESALIVITVFGKAWIRFETSRCSKISGPQETHRAKSGRINGSRFLVPRIVTLGISNIASGQAYEQSKWRLGGRVFEPDVWTSGDVQGKF
jgi:hypothetical protein